MTLVAIGLALAGAVVHAAWNLLLVRRPDPQAATAVALVVGALAWAPAAALSWRVEPAAWPYVAASSAIELTYFATLAYAFRHAAFSVVYPVGRGLAPVLVLVGAAVLLGQSAAPLEVAGVFLVCLGVLLVRGFGAAGAPLRDIGLGLAIALAIASYTLVDQQGLRQAAVLPYLWLIMAIPASIYAPLQARRVGGAGLRRELRPATVVAGLGMFGSYAFVLVALGLIDAAPVAAVRESSVVIATVTSALLGIEPVGVSRIVGSLLVAFGVALLAIGA
jgi:drug/metabolite transporter (DMT)-like permease